jgi:O-antigen ligase
VTSIAPRVSAYAHDVARIAFIALGFSIPISVAVDSVLCGAIVLAWLLTAQFRQTAETIRTNPVAAFACVWFLAHVLGAIYSIGDAREIQRTVSKAAMFLLIPIGVTLMKKPADRDRALYAFMAAIALTTLLSCLRGAGVIPADAPLLKGAVFSAAVVFKYHLTQNLLLALGAFVFAVYADRVKNRRARIVLAGLSTLAALNVLVIGDGRTGQVVLILLMLYYGAWRLGRRGFAIALCAGFIIGAAAYVLPDTAVHKRAALAMSEAEKWEPGVAARKPSSIGDRLEFYNRSLHIVSTHPLIGVGSGGFIAAYENEVRGTGLTPTHNPHNEYLLRAVELGMPGLMLLVALFWITWRTAGRLSDSAHTAIARALVMTFAVASLASSTLNDHTESLLFIWMSGVLFAGLRDETDVGRSTTTVVRLERASKH